VRSRGKRGNSRGAAGKRGNRRGAEGRVGIGEEQNRPAGEGTEGAAGREG
jgi:hypothetical protein